MAIYCAGTSDITLVSSDNKILQDSEGQSMFSLYVSGARTYEKQKIIINNVVYRLNTLHLCKEDE